MSPSVSPDRPMKRPRTENAEEEPDAAAAAAATLSSTGSDGASGPLRRPTADPGPEALPAAATQPSPHRLLQAQPEPEALPPQQQASKSPQLLVRQNSSQPQTQTPTQQQPSQNPTQPPSQSQPQSQPQPQSQSQPPTQPHRQPLQPQSGSQPPASLLPSGAVAVLPTAVPAWAQDALTGVDPFWHPKETLAVIITQQAGPAPGTHGQLQSASALFTVSPSALQALAEKKAQARLVCVQPGDGPPRRCHWYGGSCVLLNQRQFEVHKEDRVQLLLGPSQSDQAVDVSAALARGVNRVTLLWPMGIAGAVAVLRLCEPRSEADLRRCLAPPLPLAQAVAQVRAYVAGGDDSGAAAAGSAAGGETTTHPAPKTPVGAGPGPLGTTEHDPAAAGDPATAAGPVPGADGEEALGCGPVTISLRCPLHGGLVSAPAHFAATAAANPLAFFDVGAFLQMARGSGSWMCPASGRLGDLGDLRPHAFLTAVLRTLDHNGVRSRVEAIEVAPCGGWRPKDSRLPFLSALEGGSDDPAGRPPPTFDPRLLDPEEAEDGRDVVDLTDD